MKRIWVVEMLIGSKGGHVWEPTVGCGITRSQGREELVQWREDNPADRFRLREYRASSGDA